MSEAKFSKAQAAVLGTFAEDAYALSYEWVYDVSTIPLPLKSELQEPASKFLVGKYQKGDLTMYGDEVLVLLESVAAKKSWDQDDYAQRFFARFSPEYTGYLSHAAKNTRKRIEEKASATGGADPTETNALGSNAPLLLVAKDEEEYVKLAVAHTAFTHNAPIELALSEIVARALYRVVHQNKAPSAAFQEVIAEPAIAQHADAVAEVKKGLDSKGQDDVQTVKTFGQACSTSGGFPSALHFIATYENDFQKAVSANVAAGGDSAGRGLLIGAFVGAHVGADHLPAYVKDVKQYQHVVALLQ